MLRMARLVVLVALCVATSTTALRLPISLHVSLFKPDPPVLVRDAVCEWRAGVCTPTYAQLFATGAPLLSTYNSRAYARIQAYKYLCQLQSSETCMHPCSNTEAGCVFDPATTGYLTLGCPNSEVQQMAACGFDGGLLRTQAQCHSSHPRCVYEAGTCAAAFFRSLGRPDEDPRVGQMQDDWFSAMIAGDRAAWGCCDGQRLFNKLTACSRSELSRDGCGPSTSCMEVGGRCALRPSAQADILFGGELTSKTDLYGRVVAAANLALRLADGADDCAALHTEDACSAAPDVEVDMDMVAQYLEAPLVNAQHASTVCRDSATAATAAVESAAPRWGGSGMRVAASYDLVDVDVTSSEGGMLTSNYDLVL